MEMLDIVDEKDALIGKDTLENKLKKGLITRNVVIFLLDKDRKLILTKRSEGYHEYPNRYDLIACENLLLDESYEQGALRLLRDYLNIECELKYLGKLFGRFKEGDVATKYFTGIFLCHYNNIPNIKDKSFEVKRMSIRNVEELLETDKEFFTPMFVNDFTFSKNKFYF